MVSVLNYCRQFQARCIFASTSAVYEPLNTWGLLSEDSPVKPTSPYAVSKLIAENICFQQSEQYDIPCAVMRIFNVYGPGQRSTFLIPYVLECLLEKRILSLRMPEAQRDFVYIDDVVEALVKASTLHKSGATPARSRRIAFPPNGSGSPRDCFHHAPRSTTQSSPALA